MHYGLDVNKIDCETYDNEKKRGKLRNRNNNFFPNSTLQIIKAKLNDQIAQNSSSINETGHNYKKCKYGIFLY